MSNPSQPALVARGDVIGGAYDVQVLGDNAYVATDVNGLEVVSLSKPITTDVNLTGWSSAIQIEGNLAYVADNHSGLEVLDVSDRDNPRLLGSMPSLAGTEGVAVSGQFAYLANGAAGVQVVNVSNPVNLVPGNRVTLSDGAHAIRVQGQKAFVAAGAEGLVVLDLSKPDAPYVVSSTASFCVGGTALNLEVQGNLVYLVGVDGAGFQIIDVIDAAAPRLVGGYLYGWPSFHFDAVCVSGHQAYLANEADGVEILDISDLTRPVRIGGFDTEGAAVGVEVIGSLAYQTKTRGHLSDPFLIQGNSSAGWLWVRGGI